MAPSILVIGGTGTVGGKVLSQLPATDVRVRALVRNPNAARLPSHVDVMGGDPTRPETLDAWAAALGQPALVTSTVADITGKPARTFLEWATDHAAEFNSDGVRGGAAHESRSS